PAVDSLARVLVVEPAEERQFLRVPGLAADHRRLEVAAERITDLEVVLAAGYLADVTHGNVWLLTPSTSGSSIHSATSCEAVEMSRTPVNALCVLSYIDVP